MTDEIQMMQFEIPTPAAIAKSVDFSRVLGVTCQELAKLPGVNEGDLIDPQDYMDHNVAMILACASMFVASVRFTAHRMGTDNAAMGEPAMMLLMSMFEAMIAGETPDSLDDEKFEGAQVQ